MDDRTDLAFLLTSFATTRTQREASSVQEGEVSPALTASTSCVSEDGNVKPYSLDSTTEYPSDNEDKHLKRMKRNRESAALSRSRKKQYVEELLAKVQELDATVQALQAENAQLLRERASLAPSATADPPTSTPGEQRPSSESLPLSTESQRSSRPTLRSPLAETERGCSPNTRRAPHPARSISPTRAGCLALLKMTTGSTQQGIAQPCCSAASAVSHCTALHVC